MSDKYTDDKSVVQKPLPRPNRKPYEEYTPADVAARLNEARRDLTNPKSPLAKLLSDPDELEHHLQKVERLLVASIEKAFIKVGKKFDRKKFVGEVRASQDISKSVVDNIPTSEQEIVPEKKDRPYIGASKPAFVLDKTSKPEEVEKVVVVDRKGELSGVELNDLALTQDSTAEEPDDVKSRGPLGQVGRDMFSAAFPTLSKLSKKGKGKEDESTKEKLSRLSKDVFKTAFPTINKVIEYVEGERKQKSTEGVREATRSRRFLDKTESMSSALQLLTSEQRKSVDLLGDLLEAVKGLGRRSGGGLGGRLGGMGGKAGRLLKGAAPLLAGAAAIGGAYALSGMDDDDDDDDDVEDEGTVEAAGEEETEDQVYERLIQRYPASWRDDVSVQNDVRTEARLLIQQRDRQQTSEQPVASTLGGGTMATAPYGPEPAQQPTSAATQQQIPEGATPVRSNGRVVGYMPAGGGPTVAFTDTDRQTLEGARAQVTGPRSSAPAAAVASGRIIDQGLGLAPTFETPAPVATPTPVAPTPPTSSADRQALEGTRAQVTGSNTQPVSQAVTTRPQQQVSPAIAAAQQRSASASNESNSQDRILREAAVKAGLIPDVNSPGRVSGRLEGNTAVEVTVGNRTVNLYDQGMLSGEQRQRVDGVRQLRRMMGGQESLSPAAAAAEDDLISGLSPGARRSATATPAPSNDLANRISNRAPTSGGAKDEVATKTADTADVTKDAVEATPLAKDPPTSNTDMAGMSGMDLVLRAKTVTFKGDEIEFVGSVPSQVSKPGITSIPGIAPSGAASAGGGGGAAAPAPSASGGGGASSEGSGSQQLTTEQEGTADTGSLTFAAGVDPRIKKDIAQKVQQIESASGKKLTVTSGFRDPQRNAAAGGARNSAHTRANAVDIRFQGNEEDTNKLIEAASAAGIGGIGVYRPGWIHLDTESKRVWGPDFSARSIPEWSKDTLQAHMTGQIQKSSAGDGGGAAEAVAASPASPSIAEAPSSGGGGEGGGQMESSSGATAPTPEPGGSDTGSTMAAASQENAVAERTPVAPTVTAVQTGSQTQATPGAAVTETGLQSPNDPGNVEPDDAAERYAKLFNMAA